VIWEIDDHAPEIEGLDKNGRPDPAYAASLGLIAAGRGARVGAALLEWAVAVVIALPAIIALTPVLAEVVSGGFDPEKFLARPDLIWLIVAAAVSQGLMIAYVVLQLVLHGRKGVTLGKAVCGIRSVNVRTLERPTFWRGAVVRYLVAGASFLIPVIGPVLVIALSPLFDIERRGRGWLDLAAATWFVDVRHGLNPYDQKRMRIARKRVKTPEHEDKAPLPSLATPVDRDAPAEYVPSARLSGGVIGAHRGGTPAPAAPQPAESAAGAVVSAVPPSLATGAAPPAAPVPSFAPPATTPQPAPVPAPTAAPAAATPASSPAAAPVASFAPPAVASAPESAAPPVLRPAAPAPEPVAPATVAPAPAAQTPVAQTPVAAPAGTRAVLILDSGERIEVRGTTLFGRAPAAAAGEGEAQLVRVTDDTRSVSKTHLAVMPARRGVFAVDRASTNGSAIIRTGTETALVAGHPAELQIGDTVRFGDRTLTVEWV
jgi:uncharacterized RDD family membrane protein YckC